MDCADELVESVDETLDNGNDLNGPDIFFSFFYYDDDNDGSSSSKFTEEFREGRVGVNSSDRRLTAHVSIVDVNFCK